jgi:hypothetical protein
MAEEKTLLQAFSDRFLPCVQKQAANYGAALRF